MNPPSLMQTTPDTHTDKSSIFIELAHGNKEAFEFMWVFWKFTHTYDDLVDRDRPVGNQLAAQRLGEFITEISFNTFYQTHKLQLHGLIIQALTRWIDGDTWEKSESPLHRAWSSPVRCGDVDMFMHIAYLCGGWSHLRAMAKHRRYDMNSKGENQHV